MNNEKQKNKKQHIPSHSTESSEAKEAGTQRKRRRKERRKTMGFIVACFCEFKKKEKLPHC
jgi:hypothetical protein